jgi:cytochrome P450
MRPPRPEAARFDLAQNAWVMSRYPDVWTALREPYLWPVSGKREIQPESRDADGRLKQRAAMLEALSASRLEEWRPRLEARPHRLARRVALRHPDGAGHRLRAERPGGSSR